MKTFERKIQHLIAKDCLREAVDILIDAFSTVILDKNNYETVIGISASLSRLEKDNRNGTIERSESERIYGLLSQKTLQTAKNVNYGSLKLGNLSGVYRDKFPRFPEKKDDFYIEQYGNRIAGKILRIKPQTAEGQRIYLFNGYVEARTMVGHFYPADKSHDSKGAFVLRRKNVVGEDKLFRGYYMRYDDDAEDTYRIEKIEMILRYKRKFNKQEIEEILKNL